MPRRKAAIVEDPQECARAAGLRYVTDAKPGITRRKHGKSFTYTGADGKAVRDKETLSRIKAIVIPPAWSEVWICPSANGHLQATGRDARGRKQSRYHAKWREFRDETKYARMMYFAAALPIIRERVDADLSRPGLPREKVLATIVSLMEETLIRVGNEEYAKENQSFGLTTMRNKHVEIKGATITFDFRGKSKVHHVVDLTDRRLAKIVQRCADLPGYELFQYVGEDDEPRSVDSADVNEYLQQISGEHYTAKDFRTWAGTLLACAALGEFAPFASDTEAKRNVVQAIKDVAKKLGNTPSVCRKCYVHPAVVEAYLGGTTMSHARKKIDDEIERKTAALSREEKELLKLLQQRALVA